MTCQSKKRRSRFACLALIALTLATVLATAPTASAQYRRGGFYGGRPYGGGFGYNRGYGYGGGGFNRGYGYGNGFYNRGYGYGNGFYNRGYGYGSGVNIGIGVPIVPQVYGNGFGYGGYGGGYY